MSVTVSTARGGAALAGAAALAVVVAGALALPASAGKAENSVVFSTGQTAETLHPYFSTQIIVGIVADHVWDSLVFQDPETGSYVGNLATAWRWIDERTLEFDLRRGVTFHNGEPFDADDVVYSFNFLADPANEAVYLSLIRWIDHAVKVDAYKVRVVTKEPFPAAIAYLANSLFALQPNEYHARVGPNGVTERPIGTGPFRVVDYSPGKSIHLERNAGYFRGGPKAQPILDVVEVRFIPDAQTRVAEVVAGGVDFIMDVARDQADQLRAEPRLRVVEGDSPYYHFLQMSTLERSPAPQLRDIRVRRAIMHAIDRDTIVRYLVGDGGRVLNVPCHPRHFGCIDSGATRYDYDPGKARQLLAEAGFRDGFAIDLYAFRDRNQSEAIAGYLAEVGIDARLRFLQYPAVRNAARSNRAALVHNGGTTTVSDISNLAAGFFEFAADDVNRDAEIRDLLVRGDSAMEPAVREDAYAKALALIMERAYVLPLYSTPTYYVADKDLRFEPADDARPRFYEMEWR